MVKNREGFFIFLGVFMAGAPIGKMRSDVQTESDQRKLWLDENEVEGQIGLKKSWLRKRRRLGNGPPFARLNRMIRYNRATLEAWLAQHIV